MKPILLFVSLLLAVFLIKCKNDSTRTARLAKPSPSPVAEEKIEKQQVNVSDITLTLPKGFAAIEVTPGIGRARHLVVNSNGDIYVKTSNANGGKCIVLLKDKNGDGVADETTGFG